MNAAFSFRVSTTCALLLLAGACGGNPDPNAAGQGRGDPCSGARVYLFDDANFSARRLTIAYPADHARLIVAGTDASGGDLNDRTSSVRWSVPSGCKLVLYEDENFRGAQFQLVGSGRTEENSNLGSFSDKASSARWERS